jgi:LPS export ABC transporter permease LptG
MRLLDRYVLAKFTMPFLYCFGGFLAIWFIFDLADNLQDFMSGKATTEILIQYYLSQLPEITLMALPISALLAILYSLTMMSRSNEIISMLGAGVSVVRLLVPLLVVGAVLAGVAAWLNYEAVPHAAATRKQMLRDIKRGETTDTNLSGHLFRNREDGRTWFVRKIWLGRQELNRVIILQQDASGNLSEKWYADDASYDPQTGDWVLSFARYIRLDAEGNEIEDRRERSLTISGWSETPWRITSSVMNPDYLSVSELADYLKFNSDFPDSRLAPYRTHAFYRWALPTVCILVVLLAAPMAIVYSRRGVLGGIALAIVLFFLLIFTSSLFLAFGKGGRIPPFVAAWGPMLIFFFLGCVLVWYRSTGRDLPQLRMPWSS